MVSIDYSVSEEKAFVVSDKPVTVCSFARNICCCDVINSISSARQIAILAKFSRLNVVRASGSADEVRAEVADIYNFLSTTCNLNTEEVKCVFRHFSNM